MLVMFADKALSRRFHFWLTFAALTVLQAVRYKIFGGMGDVDLVPSFLIDFTVISFAFKGTILKKAFLTTLFYALIFIFEAITALAVSEGIGIITKTSPDVDTMYWLMVVISKALLLLTTLLLGKKLAFNQSPREWLLYLPLPAMTIVILVWGYPFTHTDPNSAVTEMLTGVCAFSLLSNIFLIVYMKRKEERNLLSVKVEALRIQRKMSEAYYSELNAAHALIERTAHDLKHHLDYIETADNLESVKKYALSLESRSFIDMSAFTGNRDIDALLSAKKEEIKGKDINLHIKGDLPTKIEWLDPVDIIIILGNALSNAIEGCAPCDEKNVIVSFNYDDAWLVLSVENTISIKPVANPLGNGFISGKTGAGHGLGLGNIEAAVERYGGDINYEVTDETCRLDVMLYKQAQEPVGE